MAIAALIFTILGMCCSIFMFIYTSWLLGAAGIAIGVWMIVSLVQGKKNIAAGILGILFTGVISGILYLCWDGIAINDK